MKTILLQLAMVFGFGLVNSSIHAQTITDDVEIKSLWKNIWTSLASNDVNKMFDYYTDNACEITPDGNMTCGKVELIENWKSFVNMIDEKPRFKVSDPSIRYLSPEIGILSWNSENDIKLDSKQIGGKTKSMSLIHKINGKWLIEFDAITPVLQMNLYQNIDTIDSQLNYKP